MEVREPTTADSERLRELVESAMTTSFRLSPQQIETIARDQFGADAVARKVENSETLMCVVETDDEVDAPVIAGLVEGTLDDSWGEVNWLFVDPEHRGKGIGTRLHETATDHLRDAGAERIRATVLEANSEGHQFIERFGFERAGERRVEIGDDSLVKYVYVDSSVDVDTTTDADRRADPDELDLPNTETQAGTTTATTEDGRRVFIERDERESGTEGPFFVAYTDEDHTERFGYYCSNCGSVDTTMDNIQRIECQNCGNTHASRSDEAYDDSYL